jgi:hypothetical protein
MDSRGAYIKGMVTIIGRQTLIHAIAETDVLEPDLHRVRITNPSEGKDYLNIRICIAGSPEILKTGSNSSTWQLENDAP